MNSKIRGCTQQELNAVQMFLHGPFSCLESQSRSSQPWRGRVECRGLESCGPETDQEETFTVKKDADVALK